MSKLSTFQLLSKLEKLKDSETPQDREYAIFRSVTSDMRKVFTNVNVSFFCDVSNGIARKTKVSFECDALSLSNTSSVLQELTMRFVEYETNESTNVRLDLGCAQSDEQAQFCFKDLSSETRHLVERWVEAINAVRASLFYEKCELLDEEYGFRNVVSVEKRKQYSVAIKRFDKETFPPGSTAFILKSDLWNSYRASVDSQHPFPVMFHSGNMESTGKVEFSFLEGTLPNGKSSMYVEDSVDYLRSDDAGLKVTTCDPITGYVYVVISGTDLNNQVRSKIPSTQVKHVFLQWTANCDMINRMGREAAANIRQVRRNASLCHPSPKGGIPIPSLPKEKAVAASSTSTSTHSQPE